MSIVEMWKLGIISVGDQVHVGIRNQEKYGGDYLKYALKTAAAQIECMWIYEVCSLEEMHHFRRIFSRYCYKRFRMYV